MIPLLHERDMLDLRVMTFAESIAWIRPAHRCLLCWAPRELKILTTSPVYIYVSLYRVSEVSLKSRAIVRSRTLHLLSQVGYK